MRILAVIANDLFFSALGFFLGLWWYEMRSTRKGHDGRSSSH